MQNVIEFCRDQVLWVQNLPIYFEFLKIKDKKCLKNFKKWKIFMATGMQFQNFHGWVYIILYRSFYIDLYMYAYIILELWKKNVFFIHNRTPEIVHKSTTAVIHSAFIVLWGIDRIIRLGNRKSYIVVFVRVLLLSSAMVYVQESWSA